MSDTVLRALVALPFGLVLGSFMTVVVARMPARESVIAPRSRCPRCKTEIRTRDNLPIVSWLLLRGKCRDCGLKISAEYPLTEAVTAALAVGAAVVYPSVWVAVLVGLLLAMMPAIALIDIRHRIIPNALTYPSLALFSVFVLIARLFGAPVDPLRALEGLAIYGGALFIVAFLSRGMGMGDVKLAGVIGVALGAIGLRFVGVAAGAAILFGGLMGVAALLMGRDRKSAIPFGPSMALGAVVAALWGERLAATYLKLYH
ncbi:MAG: leader peptidase (prepilin peptidase) / N-methyltransferase [Actinomycetota bacterium]|nr:leader peptidase (prepilin peptidase) / N-methyltransferase [Actinomycetota bacterium]